MALWCNKPLTEDEIATLPQGTPLMIRLRPDLPILQGTLNLVDGKPRFIYDPKPNVKGFTLLGWGKRAKMWKMDPIEA